MSFFDDSSLAFLPSGAAGKDGKAYSIKPTDGTGDFTFSRGSNLAATRVGPTGLIEKGRENLLLQSNQFDTTWTNYLSTETSGQIGYDGSSDAWLLTKSDASGQIRQNVTSSGVATFSVYAKANASDYIQIVCGSVYQFFDLSLGTLGAGSGIAAAIEAIGTNGWYRCSVSFDSSITSVRIYPAEENTTGATSGSIYIQDAQVEIGLAATQVISTGATTGKAGLLEDEPRFDYSGGATCPSLLLEPSRTNLVKYSEYLGSADWGAFPTSDPVTHTQNYAIAPDGTQTASLLGNFTSGGFNIVNNSNYRTSTLATQNPLDDTYTMSVWLKTTSGTGTISLLNRGLSSGTNSPQTLQCNVTNEWKRFEVSNTYTAAENASSLGFIIIKNNTDTLEEVLVWGAQMEQGSYPTSYIPNHSGGTITRGSDDFKVINQEGLFGTNEGTFFMEFSFNENNKYIGIGDTWPSDKVTIGLNSSGTNQIRSLIKNNGVNINLQGIGTTLGDTIKACVSYGSSGFKLFMNGSLEDSDATAANLSQFSDLIPNVDVRDVSNSNSGSIKQILIFPTTLSDADCITLTTI